MNDNELLGDVDALRSRVELIRARNELRRALCEARETQVREALSQRVSESVYYGYTSNQWGELVDPMDAYRDADLRATPLGAASRHDRKDGYNRPFVWAEIDLDLMRSQARWITTRNLLGVGAVECVTDYTVRTGYQYEPRPAPRFKQDGAARALAAQVNEVIEEFQSFNLIELGQGERYTWADREADFVWKSVTDGDAILRVFDQNEDGLTLVRFGEPEQVRQPLGSPPNYSFGILTDPRDIERRIEYAFSYGHPDDWEPVPADDVVHLALNVPSVVKRGLSDFYAGAETFDYSHKMLRNMLATGGVQAAIAWIEQFDAASASALASHVQAARDQNRPDFTRPFTGKSVNYQKLEPGSIPKVGAGRSYIPQPTAVNAASHTATLQAGLRALGCRWKMPEYMISGDASNANYASTLVAGSPFVVRVERRQRLYGRHFVLVFWRGPVRAAAKARRFRHNGRVYSYEEVCRMVDITFTAPQVAIADPGLEAEIDHKDMAAGVLSTKSRRARRGLDDETETHNIRREPITRVEGRLTDVDAQGNPVAPGKQGSGVKNQGPGEQAPAPPPEGKAAAAEPNNLRASVGGSQALLQLQTAVYKGELPREAAASNARLLFGFTPQEAAELFPDVPPKQTAPEPAPPPSAPPGGPPPELPGGLAEMMQAAFRDALREAREWDESKHPRADDGKFGSGSGHSKGGEKSEGEPQAKRPGLLARVLSAVGLGPKEAQPAQPGWADVSGMGPAERMAASPAAREFGEKLDKQHGPRWEALARQLGGTAGEARKEVASRCQKLVDGLEVHVRVKEHVLPLVLQGGFKNQFEVGSSDALYDPEGRAAGELKGMGLPRDTPAAERPKYGYLTSADADHRAETAAGMAGYGGVVVRLKARVRERATVTMGDSLRGATNGEYQASPIGAVSHRSVNPGDVLAAGPDSLADKKSWDSGHRTYIEAQLHGSISVEDIEEVGFESEPAGLLKEQMARLGVRWRVY